MLCLDATMLRKFENENRNQNKKNLRLKIYGKIRNGRLQLDPSVLIKRTCKPPSMHATVVLGTLSLLYRVEKEKSVVT